MDTPKYSSRNTRPTQMKRMRKVTHKMMRVSSSKNGDLTILTSRGPASEVVS